MSTGSRPLSPHLQVYRPELTSVLSILHRIAGVALAVGTLALLWWLISAAAGPGPFAAAEAVIGSGAGRALLFGWTLALFYHLCNGIRHLFWDAGYGYDLDTAARSGWAVMFATLVLTVIAWGIGLSAGAGS